MVYMSLGMKGARVGYVLSVFRENAAVNERSYGGDDAKK